MGRSCVGAIAFTLALCACTSSDSDLASADSAASSMATASEAATAATLVAPSPAHNPSHSSPGPDPFGIHAAPELNAPYVACARAKGFDPQVAEVFVSHSDKPMFVKTGYEVPAAVHRPCWVRLGGDDPMATSYGRP